MSLAIVQQEKAALLAAGVDLAGPCGAFRIVERVAWRLRSEGYGLLGGKSPAQNGCSHGGERYSVDWILKADGTGRDILIDAGGQNTPTWGHEEHADPALYRPAIEPMPLPDPGTPVPDPGTPNPPAEPPPPPFDPAPIYAQLLDLETRLAEAKAQVLSLRGRVDVLEHTPPPPLAHHTHRVGFWSTSGPQ